MAATKLAYVLIGDTHLGLKTDGIDRRDEITRIIFQAVDKCLALKKRGYAPALILGGDIFDDHDPSEDLIAEFLKSLSYAESREVETVVMVGNHEAIANPKRLSCLSFIKQLEGHYQYVQLVERPITVETKIQGVYLTFLPHVTRATLKAYDIENVTTQDFINVFGQEVMEKFGNDTNIVFSHLNVRHSHPGSEANLLKKSEAFLPLAFTNTSPEYKAPHVFNFHIHERQVVDNINIVGSPIYCSFGETQEKTFTTVLLTGKKMSLEVEPTNCVPFYQLYDHHLEGEFDSDPVVVKFFEEVEAKIADIDSTAVVKLSLSVRAEANNYDWEKIAANIREYFGTKIHLLPIAVKVVQKRVVRNLKQKPTLDPVEAVQVYLKANLKHDKERAKRIYKKSKKYLVSAQ